MSGSLLVRVLGPVRAVTADGDLLRECTARQRSLVALLALRNGAWVTTDELVDWLWAGDPPRTGRNAVHVAISVARAALRRAPAAAGNGTGAGSGSGSGSGSEGGSERLISRRNAYRLTLADGELDLQVFRDCRSRARRLRDRDPEAAEALLTQALQCWDGAALDGAAFSSTGAGLAAALEDERIGAQQELAELRVELGRHQEVTVELRRLLAGHPFHEPFHELLVLALWRAGRRAEALAAYESARSALAEHLGVDPGPRLRELHHRLLDDGPGPGDGPTTVPVRPAELPRDLVTFTGRRAELSFLLGRMRRPAPSSPLVVAVSGPGGVGKSALVVRAGHRAADRFPDGSLYLDLRGSTPGLAPVTRHEALVRLLRSAGLPDPEIPHDLDAAAARWRSACVGRRLLVVLDNARDSAQVRPLLPAEHGVVVLVTSRPRLTALEGVEHLELARLGQEASIELLGAVLGPETVAAAPELARTVADLCDGLPLGLWVAGVRAGSAGRSEQGPGTDGLARVAGELADGRSRLDALEVEDVGVRPALAVGYEALAGPRAEQSRAALRALGDLELPDLGPLALGDLELPDLGPLALGAYLELPEPAASGALDELARARLADRTPGGAYAVHDLLRAFARERADVEDAPAARAAAVLRVGRRYELRVHDADRLLFPERHLACELAGTAPADADRRSALAAVAAELPRTLALITQLAAGDAEQAGLAWAITERLTGFLELRGHWHDWGAAARVVDAAGERLGDPALRAHAAHVLGILAMHRQQSAEARPLLELALQERRRSGLDRQVADTLNALAIIARVENRVDDALRLHDEQLRLADAAGDLTGRSVALVNLGGLHAHAGDPAAAATWFGLAIETKQAMGERRGEGIARHGLALMQRAGGDLDAALANLLEARRLFDEVSERGRLLLLLVDLGETRLAAGRPDQARVDLKEAVALSEATGLRELGEKARAKLESIGPVGEVTPAG